MEWVTLNGMHFAAETQVVLTGTSKFTETAPGGSSAKSGWVRVAPGVSYPAYGLLVDIRNDFDYDALTDLSTVSGTTGVIASNLVTSLSQYANHTFHLPIYVPADTSIWARTQQFQAGTQVGQVGITFLPKAWNDVPVYNRITDYGAVLSASRGTIIDPGAAANTFGAWETIATGTIYPVNALLIEIGKNNNVTMTSGYYVFEIGIGAAGSEIPIFRGLFAASSNDDHYYPMAMGPFPIHIPEGTRVAARGQSSVTDATDRLFTILLHGFD